MEIVRITLSNQKSESKIVHYIYATILRTMFLIFMMYLMLSVHGFDLHIMYLYETINGRTLK